MRTVALWLSLILIFTIPWQAVLVLPGLGSLSRVTGLFIVLFWVLTVFVTGRFRKPRPVHFIILLFFLLNIVSYFWSIAPESTAVAIETYLQMAGFVLILWDLYTTPEAVRAGLQAYILGAYVAIGSLLANFLSGSTASYARYAAEGTNPNSLALVLALGLPAAFYLAASEGKSKVLRVVNYIYIPTATFAISLTATRFALLATLPAYIYGISTLGRLKPFSRVLIFALLAGVLFALPSFIPQSSLDRLATTAEEIGGGDLSGRVTIWGQGFEVFADHPLMGVGGFAFRNAVESGRSAHNSFLVVMAELGIVGFFIFVIVLAMAVYYAIRQPKWDSRLWLTILLVWALGGSAMSWSHAKATWLFLSLVIVAANVSIQAVESRRGSVYPAKSPGLFKGKRDEANETTPAVGGTGFRTVNGGRRLPFRRETSQGS